MASNAASLITATTDLSADSESATQSGVSEWSIPDRKVVVFYTRFSSDMQSKDTCEAQVQVLRRHFMNKGIDTSGAMILSDEGWPGDREDRPAYQHLKSMLNADRVAILGIYDLSRLSRNEGTVLFIRDVLYQGGRVVAPGDHLDTDDEGWEANATFKTAHHAMSNRDTSRRVRDNLVRCAGEVDRGIGDFIYGFSSEYVDADWLKKLTTRGPKPRKRIIIDEKEAAVVREIFRLFTDERMSMSAIARGLNNEGVRRPRAKRIVSPYWSANVIRRILSSEKYIGKWVWGKTITVRNSRGKKRHVEDRKAACATTERPHLRIIDQIVWLRAQELQRATKEPLGGLSRRNEAQHPKHVFPSHNLFGLIRCDHCGRKLSVGHNKAKRYFYCKNHRRALCPMKNYLRVEIAETTIYEQLRAICEAEPNWFATILTSLRAALEHTANLVPSQTAANEERLTAVRKIIGNLVDALGEGGQYCRSISAKIADLEAEQECLQRCLAERNRAAKSNMAFPSNDWIKAQLQELPKLFAHPSKALAHKLRAIFKQVRLVAELPVRKKGRLWLKLTVDHVALLGEVLGEDWRGTLAPRPSSNQIMVNAPQEIAIPVPGQSAYYEWGLKIAKMNDDGWTWAEISEATGLKPAMAQWALRLHAKSQR